MKKLDYKKRKQMMYSVCYTLCRYLDKVNLSGIYFVDPLSFRYLSCNLLALKEDFEERKKQKCKID